MMQKETQSITAKIIDLNQPFDVKIFDGDIESL